MGNNIYEPIKEEDIRCYGEYGVIYEKVSPMFPLGEENIIPIGYQPFTRCYKQRGYYIDTNNHGDIRNYDLVRSGGFKKRFFRRTPKLSKEIYDKFNGGKDLFPYDNIEILSKVIENIKESKLFSKDNFNEIYRYSNSSKSKEQWISILRDKKINITYDGFTLKEGYFEKLNEEWDIKSFADKLGLAIGSRRVMYEK